MSNKVKYVGENVCTRGFFGDKVEIGYRCKYYAPEPLENTKEEQYQTNSGVWIACDGGDDVAVFDPDFGWAMWDYNENWQPID